MRYFNRSTKDCRGIHDGFGKVRNAAGLNRGDRISHAWTLSKLGENLKAFASTH